MSDGLTGGGLSGQSEVLPRRHARGRRPQYFDDPSMDQMHATIMALTQELSVVIDRLDTIETVMDDKGFVSRSDIEEFRLTESTQMARRAKRSAYIGRVFRGVSGQREVIERGDSRRTYADSISEDDVTEE